ncbi:STAS domain-containing protein [Actinomycetospora cinnamomea]|uniref:STAS domain-containing protein n=1 Tax=Actinomycetospora cinnamomea TaxID=663609 RepID=UPI0010577B3E|nr:STAS domain-containing protein [Actinomycetospora cinnamomea]
MTTSSAHPFGVGSPDDAFVSGLTVAPTQPCRGLVLVRVLGEVDMLTAPRLGDVLDGALRTVADDCAVGRDPIAPAQAPSVVCDLEGVTFFGASGLDVFAAAQQTAAARGVRLVVVAGCRTVRRPFRLTALDRRIMLTDTHPALAHRRAQAEAAR